MEWEIYSNTWQCSQNNDICDMTIIAGIFFYYDNLQLMFDLKARIIITL